MVTACVQGHLGEARKGFHKVCVASADYIVQLVHFENFTYFQLDLKKKILTTKIILEKKILTRKIILPLKKIILIALISSEWPKWAFCGMKKNVLTSKLKLRVFRCYVCSTLRVSRTLGRKI